MGNYERGNEKRDTLPNIALKAKIGNREFGLNSQVYVLEHLGCSSRLGVVASISSDNNPVIVCSNPKCAKVVIPDIKAINTL